MDRFRTAVTQWGIAPSEFWQMTPVDWWAVFDAHHPEQRLYSGMTADECDELLDMLDEAG